MFLIVGVTITFALFGIPVSYFGKFIRAYCF
jgi:cytochrome c biogenesis protein CcdA